MAALDAGVSLRDVQIAARHAELARRPWTTGGAKYKPFIQGEGDSDA